MSPLSKGLLASALTLPLVAFVAVVLASPEAVDPDRSRPVIIGRVNDDQPTDKPRPSSQREQKPSPGDKPRDEPRDPAGVDADDDPDDGRGADVTDDQPYTVVTPAPRDLDDDDDDGDDDRDDRDDDTDDREGSGDD